MVNNSNLRIHSTCFFGFGVLQVWWHSGILWHTWLPNTVLIFMYIYIYILYPLYDMMREDIKCIVGVKVWIQHKTQFWFPNIKDRNPSRINSTCWVSDWQGGARQPQSSAFADAIQRVLLAGVIHSIQGTRLRSNYDSISQCISRHFQSPGHRTRFQIFRHWRCEPPPVGKEAQACARYLTLRPGSFACPGV